mmetsp:Transcript_4356/g.7425  ORF Transcript_4356/g.7425 Transcript_4356/m.7425 type:complete len:367 (-) Transcript_4356:1234-2334(-)
MLMLYLHIFISCMFRAILLFILTHERMLQILESHRLVFLAQLSVLILCRHNLNVSLFFVEFIRAKAHILLIVHADINISIAGSHRALFFFLLSWFLILLLLLCFRHHDFLCIHTLILSFLLFVVLPLLFLLLFALFIFAFILSMRLVQHIIIHFFVLIIIKRRQRHRLLDALAMNIHPDRSLWIFVVFIFLRLLTRTVAILQGIRRLIVVLQHKRLSLLFALFVGSRLGIRSASTSLVAAHRSHLHGPHHSHFLLRQLVLNHLSRHLQSIRHVIKRIGQFLAECLRRHVLIPHLHHILSARALLLFFFVLLIQIWIVVFQLFERTTFAFALPLHFLALAFARYIWCHFLWLRPSLQSADVIRRDRQ